MIIVKDFLNMAFSYEDGMELREKINMALKTEKPVEVDFEGINVFTTMFFNACFGHFVFANSIDWYNEIDFRKDLCSFIESDDILWGKVKVRVSIDSENYGYEEIDYRVNDLILKNIIEEARDICGDIYTIKIDFVFDDEDFEYEKYPSYVEGYVYEGLFNSGKTVMRPFS